MSSQASALELSHISKRFGAITALDDVGLVVRPGTVHALLGENGAGKSTLMRIAYGMLAADDGRIRRDGCDVRFKSSRGALSSGIGMVHQHFTLVPEMTVAENLALGGSGRLRLREMKARVRELADRTGFALSPDARVEELPVGAQQRVEIAKALTRHASLLILDEPTAVLAPAEIDDLLRWLREYVAGGNAAVVITHKLHEALAVADDVTILRNGRVVHHGAAHASTVHSLTTAMIGEGVAAYTPYPTAPNPADAATIIRANDLVIADETGRVRVHGASFHVRAGELIGIAAIEGAGQRELLRALAGRRNLVSGHLERPAHVGFIPEDRHRDAVLLHRSLAENLALRGAGQRRGFVNWSTLHAWTARLIRDFDVRTLSTAAHMDDLSGGNQQKMVLARELAATPDAPAPNVLVVENPTRGLDVRASAEVHARLREACARGACVVAYSSDLDEVLALSTRIFVLSGGTLREVSNDRAIVGRAMLGLP